MRIPKISKSICVSDAMFEGGVSNPAMVTKLGVHTCLLLAMAAAGVKGVMPLALTGVSSVLCSAFPKSDSVSTFNAIWEGIVGNFVKIFGGLNIDVFLKFVYKCLFVSKTKTDIFVCLYTLFCEAVRE